MSGVYYFPFGQELKRVEQKDRTPKKAFVLGVYASAVHARWIDKDGKQKVSALAVASEPEIFWRGEKAEQIISAISIPPELGKLTVPTNSELNGPSGQILDNLFLSPLGQNRETTWLCDLLPESRVNPQQCKALYTHYTAEIINKYNLKPATIPHFDKQELNSPIRREEILCELEQSKAETLILLGDLPIKWFLRFHDRRFSRLSQFGETEDKYGRHHDLNINNKYYSVIPLCHPRQAGSLGRANRKWTELHARWLQRPS